MDTPRLGAPFVHTAVLVVAGPALGERIAASLGPQCAPLLVSGRAECDEALRRSHFSCAIVEISASSAFELGSAVRVIRRRAPLTRIIGYVSADQRTAGPLILAARDGLDDIVFRAERDISTLRDCVLRSLRGSQEDLEMLTKAVATFLPPRLCPLVCRCLTQVGAAGGVSELARSLHWHRNTLAMHLQRLGGPSPERFRAWCLLLRIGFLLDETSLSIECIALRLGFSSASAVSHLTSRYLSTTPSHLRANGAVRLVTARFAADCS